MNMMVTVSQAELQAIIGFIAGSCLQDLACWLAGLQVFKVSRYLGIRNLRLKPILDGM